MQSDRFRYRHLAPSEADSARNLVNSNSPSPSRQFSENLDANENTSDLGSSESSTNPNSSLRLRYDRATLAVLESKSTRERDPHRFVRIANGNSDRETVSPPLTIGSNKGESAGSAGSSVSSMADSNGLKNLRRSKAAARGDFDGDSFGSSFFAADTDWRDSLSSWRDRRRQALTSSLPATILAGALGGIKDASSSQLGDDGNLAAPTSPDSNDSVFDSKLYGDCEPQERVRRVSRIRSFNEMVKSHSHVVSVLEDHVQGSRQIEPLVQNVMDGIAPTKTAAMDESGSSSASKSREFKPSASASSAYHKPRRDDDEEKLHSRSDTKSQPWSALKSDVLRPFLENRAQALTPADSRWHIDRPESKASPSEREILSSQNAKSIGTSSVSNGVEAKSDVLTAQALKSDIMDAVDAQPQQKTETLAEERSRIGETLPLQLQKPVVQPHQTSNSNGIDVKLPWQSDATEKNCEQIVATQDDQPLDTASLATFTNASTEIKSDRSSKQHDAVQSISASGGNESAGPSNTATDSSIVPTIAVNNFLVVHDNRRRVRKQEIAPASDPDQPKATVCEIPSQPSTQPQPVLQPNSDSQTGAVIETQSQIQPQQVSEPQPLSSQTLEADAPAVTVNAETSPSSGDSSLPVDALAPLSLANAITAAPSIDATPNDDATKNNNIGFGSPADAQAGSTNETNRPASAALAAVRKRSPRIDTPPPFAVNRLGARTALGPSSIAIDTTTVDSEVKIAKESALVKYDTPTMVPSGIENDPTGTVNGGRMRIEPASIGSTVPSIGGVNMTSKVETTGTTAVVVRQRQPLGSLTGARARHLQPAASGNGGQANAPLPMPILPSQFGRQRNTFQTLTAPSTVSDSCVSENLTMNTASSFGLTSTIHPNQNTTEPAVRTPPSNDANSTTTNTISQQVCAGCQRELSAGTAMYIEQLKSVYHLTCFVCNTCRRPLSTNGSATNVCIAEGQLHCMDCWNSPKSRGEQQSSMAGLPQRPLVPRPSAVPALPSYSLGLPAPQPMRNSISQVPAQSRFTQKDAFV